VTYRVVDEDFEERIESDSEFRNRCLCLDQHPTFPRHFTVEYFDAAAATRLELNRYRAVGVLTFEDFQEKATEQGYEIWFLEDPSPQFEWARSLSDDPGVELHSDFPGTYKGLLPFQIQGVNFVKNLRGGLLQHSTGTGKQPSSIAVTLWHLKEHDVDLVIHAVKRSNLINLRRAFKRFADIDAEVVWGPRKRRQKIYDGVEKGSVLIVNYEKFRDDKEQLMELVEDKRVFVCFDEPHGKIQNRTSGTYKGLCEVLYTSYTVREDRKLFYPEVGSERPSQMWLLALSATPIKKNPVNFFNILRILDPSIFGSVKNFNRLFVTRKNRWREPVDFGNLDLMSLMAAHIVHHVDKEADPEIAAQFPKVVAKDVMVQLDDRDRKIYNALIAEYEQLLDGEESDVIEDTELLAAINCLHLLCASSQSVLRSADLRLDYEEELAEWEDSGCKGKPPQKRGSMVALKLVMKLGVDAFDTKAPEKGKEVRSSKLQALLDEIMEHDEKIVVFTRLNDMVIPFISEALSANDIEHVVFHGGLTTKAAQEAQDRFRYDPDCKVFVSSDAGQDSIDLEMSNKPIDFDEPQDYVGKVQRLNRTSRLTSTFEHIYPVTILVEGSVEERTREIWQRKREYHQALGKESAAQSMALRRNDLIYILTGRESE
jgi:SNF2 family DNA or RNA helicase